jgi:thiol-disulfide isomerase/thioredoxin
MPDSGFSKSSEADRQLLPPERSRLSVWPWLAVLVGLMVMLVLRAALKPDFTEPEQRGEHHPAAGTKLTRFHLEPLTGESREVSIGDLDDKVTLINFWGPWCGACVIEFPHLVELEKHFRSQPGFQFLSISSNYNPADETDLAENTERFLKQQQAEFPAYRDPQGQTTIALIQAAKIESFGYPATVLLGKGGVIRGVWIGYVPGDETALRQAIEKSLQANGNKS